MIQRKRPGGAATRADVIAREEAADLAKRIFGMLSGATAQVSILSSVNASTTFARGDTYMASERASTSVWLDFYGRGGRALVLTTRVDDAGLKQLVAEAEQLIREWRGPARTPDLLGPQIYKTPPKLYFEANLSLMTPEGRAELCTAALDATEAAGLVGAGAIGLYRRSRAVINTEGLFGYTAETYGEFSLTARTKDGTGSGWAWSGHEDWTRVNGKAVIEKAVHLAQRAAHPVAIEPGRYTVILEPEAVASLLGWDLRASQADAGYTVFSKDPRGTNKVGLQMMDARLNLVSDPWDPELPQATVGGEGEPVDRVQWFKDGVLRALIYGRHYAREKGRAPLSDPGKHRLYSTGPTQSLEEMIANTRRGIWVHRLDGIAAMNPRTGLLTGTTRDGTFLIENGRVSKAIKNLRFTESPFFVFNKLEAAGDPVRARSATVAPRLKVRDFNFTSLTEAV